MSHTTSHPAPAQPRNALHGVTLEAVVMSLVQAYGWDGLAERIRLRCFTHTRISIRA